MDISHLITGQTYKAYPFLALYSMGQMDSDIANEYVTIPYCGAKEFKVVSREEFYGLSVSINAIENLGMVSYTVTISCKKLGVNIYYGGLELRFSDSKPNDALIMGEWSKMVDPVFVEAGTPYRLTGEAPATGGVDEHPGYVFRVHLSTSLGVIDREAYIISQITPSI